MIAGDDTRHGLSQGAVKIRVVIVRKEAIALHDLIGDNDVLRVAADEAVRISKGIQLALPAESGLNGKAVPGLKFMAPLFTDGKDLTAELVTDDRGMLGNIVGNAGVLAPLEGRLVGGHTNAVRDHLGKDLVLLHFGKLKLLKAQIVLAVDTDRFCFHSVFLCNA